DRTSARVEELEQPRERDLADLHAAARIEPVEAVREDVRREYPCAVRVVRVGDQPAAARCERPAPCRLERESGLAGVVLVRGDGAPVERRAREGSELHGGAAAESLLDEPPVIEAEGERAAEVAVGEGVGSHSLLVEAARPDLLAVRIEALRQVAE